MIVAGTGHRPDKLYLGYSDEGLKILMNLAIRYLRDRKVDAVISGLALGWDTALALAAVVLKLPLIAAIPFAGQESRWKDQDVKRYLKLILYAEKTGKVVYVSSPGYSGAKMMKRNKWMVDKCDELVSLWDGSDGGTANCVKYAIEVGRKMTNLWDKYQLLINRIKQGHEFTNKAYAWK